MIEPKSLFEINPQLSGIKKEADAVKEAIEEFRHLWRLEPCFLVIPPSDWRAGSSCYCNLEIVVDPSVAKWKVSA